jgi:DNA-binding XRE family transcriptional regulator
MTHTELLNAKLGIANRLREARISKGLSQDKLGELVDTSRDVIQKIENGEVWHPSVIAELAVALDVNPAWLQWGEPFAPMQIDYCLIGRYPK